MYSGVLWQKLPSMDLLMADGLCDRPPVAKTTQPIDFFTMPTMRSTEIISILPVKQPHEEQDSETMQWAPANDARIPQICYQGQGRNLVNDWPVLDVMKRTYLSATNKTWPNNMLGHVRSIYKEGFPHTKKHLSSPSHARKYHVISLLECTVEYQIESQGNDRKSWASKELRRKERVWREQWQQPSIDSMIYSMMESTWTCLQLAKALRMSSTFLLPLQDICFSGLVTIQHVEQWVWLLWPLPKPVLQLYCSILWQQLQLKKRCNHAVTAVLLRRNVKVQEITKAQAVSWFVEKTLGVSMCPKFRW